MAINISKRTKLVLTIIFAYISITGLVTFSLFIHEEAIQMVMFGTWPAKNAKQWHIVLEGTDIIRKIVFSSKVVNYCFGWIQPLAFISYKHVAKSAEYYIKGTEAECFAHAPELFVGRQIEIRFYPQRLISIDPIMKEKLAVNRRIGIFTNKSLSDLRGVVVKGTVIKYQNYLVIE